MLSLRLKALAYDINLVTFMLRNRLKEPTKKCVQPTKTGCRDSAMSHEKGIIYDRASDIDRELQPG
jgi:hypothetical protein